MTNEPQTTNRRNVSGNAKMQFGRALSKLIAARGWNQSDLARAAGITRDNVSRYVRGQSLPDNPNLHAIAMAFGMTPEELLPEEVMRSLNEFSAIEFSIMSSDPRTARLRVDQVVSTVVGKKILELLTNDKIPPRE